MTDCGGGFLHWPPFSGGGVAGFAWWGMVAAFHVAAMVEAMAMAKIAESKTTKMKKENFTMFFGNYLVMIDDHPAMTGDHLTMIGDHPAMTGDDDLRCLLQHSTRILILL
ncbi:hypothetical protein E2542_SST25734 [Spatholobus suberectus]|nr:hypothetical protein E2542_SST25734 [Spatholobus suberectus]